MAPITTGSSTGYSAQDVVSYATQPAFLNTRYVDHTTIQGWGPGRGWDCSSYTQYVMKKYGVNLPAYSDSQYKMGQPVDRSALQPGDLVFYHTSANKVTGHVAIYIGNGKVVNALNSRAGTVVSSLDGPGKYVGARRYVNFEGNATYTGPTHGGTSGKGGATGTSLGAGESATPPSGQDTLSIDDLAAAAGFTGEFLQSNPELADIWTEAVNNGWNDGSTVGQQKFINAVRNSKWWTTHSDSARTYLVDAQRGGADFQQKRADALAAIQNTAVKIGAKIDPGTAERLTTAYLYNGWDKRPDQLVKALTGDLGGKFGTSMLDMQAGNPQSFIMELKALADANGVKYDDPFYEGAAKMIISGMRTLDDYKAEIRSHAASRMPIFGDRIKAGENARDIASPYINRMADTFGIDAKGIGLDDPWITKALGATGADGKPTAMSFYDFQTALRQDPRWSHSSEAHSEVDQLIGRLGQMFGFGGS